jgi:hypothetical protein
MEPAPTQPPAPTPDLGQIATEVAGTVVAQLTLSAPVPTETPIPSPTAASVPVATDNAVAAGTEAPTIQITPIDGVMATAAPLTDYDLVYQDNFESTFWTKDSNNRWKTDFNSGGYRMSVFVDNLRIWSIRSASYHNVSVEVDAYRKEGPRNGQYGIVCRHQDASNFYSLVISSDGTYAILKNEGGKYQTLFEAVEPTPAISSGSDVTRMRADCIGNTLTLYANGQQLASVQDNTFVSGAIGLTTGTRGVAGMVAIFDNLAVYAPKQ